MEEGANCFSFSAGKSSTVGILYLSGELSPDLQQTLRLYKAHRNALLSGSLAEFTHANLGNLDLF